MKKFTRDELISELASNLTVRQKGYGTWEVQTYVGYSSDPHASDYYNTHDESDITGEFDGETYNPQDIDEWLSTFKDDTSLQAEYYDVWYENYDFADAGWDSDIPDADSAEAQDTYIRWIDSVTKEDPIFEKIYEKICDAVWSDAANSDNYTPDDDRELGIAKRFVNMWDDGYCPDDVIIDDEDYYVLESDSDINGLHLVQGTGVFTDFTDDFTEDELQDIYDKPSETGWRRKVAGLLFGDADAEIAENPNLLDEILNSSYIGTIKDLVQYDHIPVSIFY